MAIKKRRKSMADEKKRARPATQHDVARVAGVSQSAVSRVYAARGYVSEDLRKRIARAARTLQYQPDALARGLITGRSSIVAIVIAGITNPFYPWVLDVLTDALQRRGWQMFLFNAAGTQTVDDVIPSVLQYRVRGVVIMTAELSSNTAALCKEKRVPVVLFNRYTRKGGIHGVACDNERGGEMAAESLLAAGCKQIAYIGGLSNSSTNVDRKVGFLRVLNRHDCKPVAVVEKNFTYVWGAEAVDQIIQASPTLDGLFCGDDAVAFGAIDALRSRYQRRIPLDVSVIGFDDIPSAGWPAYDLTTIRQPVERMVEATLAVLESPPERSEVVLLAGQFISRGTVRSKDEPGDRREN
jgi:DNA-binding LacI/PurR family transcriptional regulator